MKNDDPNSQWLFQWLSNLKQIQGITHTKPTVYIPVSLRNKHGSYKPLPSEKIRVNWQHYHPTKKKRIQVRKSAGIKNFKTLAEQKKFAKGLCKAYELMLSRGYNPFSEEETIKTNGLVDELQRALDSKEFSVSLGTFRPYKSALNKFVTWLKTTNHVMVMVNAPEIGYIIDSFFLHLRKEKTNATSYNNIRSSLSTLFTQLIKDRAIETNPITAVEKLKADPKKNKPFTDAQIQSNSDWMKENDKALHTFIKIIAYSFLRPNEVMRLKIGDIDFNRNMLKIKTKSQETEMVPIIKQLKKLLVEMGIQNYPSDYSLITLKGSPGVWPLKTEQKLKNFNSKFKKLKKAKGYNSDYTVYSYRHSMALLVFKSFKKENLTDDEIILKMKSVTRHKSVAGLKNYLRGIGAYVAKDYGERINIEL